MTAKRNIIYFLKNHVGPFFLRFFLYVVTIALLFYFSVWCTFRYSHGIITYENAQFDWSFHPNQSGYVPVDSAYNNYNILLDAHSHTDYSDGWLTPEQNIQWHIANGYNAMILSDHNTVKGGTVAQQIAREKYDDKIKVLVAQEYTCCRIHMNLVGINATIPSVAWPTDEDIMSIVNQTHAQGGFVVVNHIPWSENTLYDQFSIQDLYNWGVDYVEVINQDTFDYQDYRFAIKNNMGYLSGTDMHNPSRGVNGWTTLISNFTEEAIMEALKQKKTSVIYSAIDSPYGAPAEQLNGNLILDPFMRLGNMLTGYYSYYAPVWSFNGSYCGPTSLTIEWKLIWIFVGWLAAGFVFFEIFRQVVVYTWESCRAKGRCGGKKRQYIDMDENDRTHLLEMSTTNVMTD